MNQEQVTQENQLHEENEFVVEDVAEEEEAQENVKQEDGNISLEQQNVSIESNSKTSIKSPSQELFAKYVRLENNLKNLQRNYDTLLNEKTVLDKMLKTKDAALIKTTLDFENNVEQLEKLKDTLKLKDNQIKNLKAEKKTLEEMTSLSQMANNRKPSDGKNRNNVIMPEDSLDRIIALENELKLKDVKISTLENEIHTVRLLIDKKDKAIEKLEESLKTSDQKRDRVYELEARNSEFIIQLEKAQKEIRTLQEISRMKTRTIEKLNEEIEQLREDDENRKDEQRKSVQINKEIDRLKMELKVARKSIEKRDKEMDKIVNDRDIIPLKTLEGDKRFLQSELKKNLEKIAQLERTIQTQEKKLQSYKQRLANVIQALKETKLDKMLRTTKAPAATAPNEDKNGTEIQRVEQAEDQEEEMVATTLYNLLQKDVEELRKISFERDIALVEKDTVIESLEKKIDILERSKISDQKAHKRKVQELQEKIEEMTKKIVTNEEQFKQQEKQLKKEALIVKKKLHQTKGIVKK
jgi:hypothetical protein